MTESNNYCKKNQPNKQTSNWRSFVFELEHSKASRKLNLEHWENESRARVGALGNKSRARVGALGNESRARVGAFQNSRPSARMIVCQYHDRQHFHPA